MELSLGLWKQLQIYAATSRHLEVMGIQRYNNSSKRRVVRLNSQELRDMLLLPILDPIRRVNIRLDSSGLDIYINGNSHYGLN